ncbi:MAG: hypothetical protein KAV87_29750 [Desulfobacteraceae bacterium]|nr:hypothetical protein [Desulfobacteraceae bacterium]
MSEDIYILGIHDGHNCGATLTRNGLVVASVSEERLTRNKNEVGFPERSIKEVIRIGGIEAHDLHEVAYASLFMHSPDYLRDLEPWYIVGLDQQRQAHSRPEGYRKMIFEQRRRERIRQAMGVTGLSESQIVFVEHHLAHLAAAYYTSPLTQAGKPILGITCDGSGDGISVTVSVCRGVEMERIATTYRHASLGKIYSRVTMLMGMKPWEHEYKLMGLAPYADPEHCRKAAEALHSLLGMRDDGLGFKQVGELSTNYCYEYLRDSFERVRFDVIAGATQLFTDEMLLNLLRGCIRKTGIPDVVCSGGVFMNVKANMLISELPEVRSMYVMPSSADESLSIGACLYRYYDRGHDTDISQSTVRNLYLGADFDPTEEEKAMAEMLGGKDVEVSVPEDMDMAILDILLKGRVVARCKGRMEWGARALGNRSILAPSSDYRIVDRINKMIKLRDFWMPFAPSIREESASRYFDDPKDLRPYFMTFAFRSKPDTYPDLIAGSHPSDHTIRPQVVTREASPDFHRLLTAYEEATGRGCILNTSFNLHGHPIVYSPQDAIEVFLNSGLRYLALNNYLLSKEPVS